MPHHHKPNFVPLLTKEWRELLASRSFWLLLMMIGPLVGHAFLTAVGLYAEASGIGGGAAALSQGLTPLDGIVTPTFGAYDLAATFLFPFVAIRVIAAEKQSGGMKILLQLPGGLATKISAKALVLLAAWLVTLIPGLVALVLWKFYGGHLYAPETANVLFGHLLRTMLSASVAVTAAALLENASSAAIVTLGFTVGTWALEYVAAFRGGFLQQLASYTPASALRYFEQGLHRLNTTVAMVAIISAGFALAAFWLHTGRTWRFRLISTAAIVLLLTTIVYGANSLSASWDVSENRRNSFSASDEAALKQISQPLNMTVVLAPEDPRLADFEKDILRKLRRTMPQLRVQYAASSVSGLFEKPEDHYGEIWYEMNGQKIMERSAIEQVVLETVYKLAGVSPPEKSAETEFPGYPLAVRPRIAGWIFYGAWPLVIVLGWWLTRRHLK
jgi:ABC-type transport system involved in multi-copper enzyme maturation permease subunit